MNKFEELFAQYGCDAVSDQQISASVADMIAQHYAENNTPDVWAQCLNQIDLTTLSVDDTTERVSAMAEHVNQFQAHFPGLKNVAAICVYPAMVPVVKQYLKADNIGIASCCGGFPASQTYSEIKVAETSMAVMEGSTEIDVVLSVGKFLEGNYVEAYDDLCEMKAACREAHLKVILETGALLSCANIKRASILAMQAGADFIKTSTGKIAVSATPEAAYVMCCAIKEWYEKTGERVGFKAAGGISTTADAVKYYTIVKHVLGKEWLNNRMFRFGASRLANNLLSSLQGHEVKYF
mgnify:CR=1 FL=1